MTFVESLVERVKILLGESGVHAYFYSDACACNGY